MMVTGLPFPFDLNELELRNVEFWWLRKLLWEAYKSDFIQYFLNVPRKHVLEKQKEIWLSKKNNILLSPLLFNCNITLNRQFTFLVNRTICFSVRICDNSLLVLKMPFQVFSFSSKKVQGFALTGRYKCCCYQCSFIYKILSQFFEILVFSQDIWRNVHFVPEVNLIS